MTFRSIFVLCGAMTMAIGARQAPSVPGGTLLVLSKGDTTLSAVDPSTLAYKDLVRGPFWQRKDDGAWSLPKGEVGPGESLEAVARREFREETGHDAPHALVALTPVRQAGGKVVHAFAAEGDLDPASVRSNTFTMEWPPRSGAQRTFPEVDRAAWFDLPAAAVKLLAGQRPVLLELADLVAD